MELNFLRAISTALSDELQRDPAVYILGEDVSSGGPFGATQGLAKAFGSARVVDTPISEGTVVGLAVGAALTGLRPVVELMFMDFVTLAFDQLVNEAAKYHYMSGGQFRVPLVVRVQQGATGAWGPHHSQSLEALLVHIPGLKVVSAFEPADAKGLLTAAIRDDNPVVFIEHRGLYFSETGAVPDGEHVVPLGVASIRRPGRDVTIVAYSAMVRAAVQAAEVLAVGGIEAEVVDLRSLLPMDSEAILNSVKKTKRAAVVHEAPVSGGFGAEIAARIQEVTFDHLEAPVLRVGAPFVPVPSSPALERVFVPGVDQIVSSVTQLLDR